MASEEDGYQAPRFEGEDVSPTTERELRGWYSTGLAAEIFAVCGVGKQDNMNGICLWSDFIAGSFAPVTLEQLARESGVLRSDGTTPCIQAKASANGRLAQLLVRVVSRRDDEDSQCIVRPFGRDMATSSFAMYTFSIAVFVQALVLISFSPVADYGTFITTTAKRDF